MVRLYAGVNPHDIDRWKNEVLSEVLLACALSDVLRPVLIFKGARILSQRLCEGRMSYDLDSTFSERFALNLASTEARVEFLEREIPRAVEVHFAGTPVVRYSLEQTRVETIANKMGWEGYQVRLKIRDSQKSGVLGLPTIDLDVGAPEKLSKHSVSQLRVDHHSVSAYTLERIAGEKLRAFLSSLPEYREKVGGRPYAVRVKDLYDLSRILAEYPIADDKFWDHVGEEFRLACESRYIDCAGLSTFTQNWRNTEASYKGDVTLPKDIGFAQVEAALSAIVLKLEQLSYLPLTFPLPPELSARVKRTDRNLSS